MNEWHLVDNSIFYYQNYQIKSNKVAAFDLDGTLIHSDDGLVLPTSEYDFVYLLQLEQMVEFFTRLTSENWTVVIFSNQKEITSVITYRTLKRISNVFKILTSRINNFAPLIYVSIRDDNNRKPQPGMYSHFLTLMGTGVAPESYYCGDAYGIGASNPRYRWSDTDRVFASNIGLKYYTPDQILGTIKAPDVSGYHILLCLRAEASQVKFDLTIDERIVVREMVTLEEIAELWQQNKIPLVTGPDLSTFTNRSIWFQALQELNPQVKAAILIFTEPIEDKIRNLNKKLIQDYAQN